MIRTRFALVSTVWLLVAAGAAAQTGQGSLRG